VKEALVHIERGRLLSPLLVLQTLATNKNLTLSVVKEYVGRCLADESAALAQDQVPAHLNLFSPPPSAT
jgi:hypothetical protein